MPIESLQLANFKNLKHIKGEKFSQIVIIAGPNGVGKSTLLDCIWREENCNLTKSENLKIAYISPNIHDEIAYRYIDDYKQILYQLS